MDNVMINVGEIAVKEVFQLQDGRMELRWDAIDVVIPEEIEYLARACAQNVSRTEAEATNQPDPVEYLFTREAFWEGLRCPKEVWGLFMKCKGYTDDEVDQFNILWAKSPVKDLQNLSMLGGSVDQVRSSTPLPREGV